MINYIFNSKPNKDKCKQFIIKNHYLKTSPSAYYHFSLEENGEIIGVCTFSKPSRQNIKIENCLDIIELSRLVVKNDTPKNTESFFIGSCLRWIKQNSQWEAVITFADSSEGHTGTIYKASNFIFLGYTKKNYHYLNNSGKRIHKRQVWNRAKLNNISEKDQANNEQLLKIEEQKKSKFVYYLIPEKQKKLIIYGLIDPQTGFIRYVGKSTKGYKRYYDHINPKNLKNKTHKNNWINSLLKQNIQPSFEILEVVDNVNKLDELEEFYIEYFKSLGLDLTNSTDGGKGSLGRKCDEITKTKMREAALKRERIDFIPHNKKDNVIINGIKYRECGNCKKQQELDQYYFDNKKNKWQANCKSCRLIISKEYREKCPIEKLPQEEYNKSRLAGAKAGGQALSNNPEARATISKKMSKAIIGTHVDTGTTIEFESALKAKEAGFQNSNIGQAIKYNKPYKNYNWKFKI